MIRIPAVIQMQTVSPKAGTTRDRKDALAVFGGSKARIPLRGQVKDGRFDV